MTVETAGFRTVVRSGVRLEVQQVGRIDVVMEVGAVSERIDVKAAAPVLASETASLGQVIDSKAIEDLPVAGGGVYGLIRLTGLPTTSALTRMIDPTSPAQAAAVSVAGARTNNIEFTLDGIPIMSRSMSAKMVPMEAVQEFRMEISPSDAALGHSAGGFVNTSLKSGTNELHGTLWEFHHNNAMRSLDYFAKRWLNNPATGAVTDAKERQANPKQTINRYGASAGGPMYIPRVYSGKNRTFWMYTYESFRWSRGDASFFTVPTASQRGGDFSELLGLGSQYQIYDPATIKPGTAGRFTRDPFPGNIIPASRISPIAKKILPYWPDPNNAGTRDGLNNYFSPNPFHTNNNNHTIRIDHAFSERDKLSASAFIYDQYYTQTNAFYFPNIAVGQGVNDSVRYFALDYVHVFGPSSILNVRAGTAYFGRELLPVSNGFDITTLGFSQKLVEQAGPDGKYFPQIVVNGFATLGTTGKSGYFTNTPALAATLTRTVGRHTLKLGADLRVLRENNFNVGNASPRFNFAETYTRGPVDNSPVAPVGQGLASFLLGTATGGQVNRNPAYSEQSTYYGFYIQDDVKVTPKVTLNLGLRYEYEGPVTERYNRSVRGFAEGVANPVEAQARANYAGAPIPEVPAAAFRTPGGVTFAGVNGEPRTLWQPDRNNFAPRIGLAYSLNPRTVLRAGYAVMFDQLGINRRNVIQTGYSQTTNLIPSLDNGQTFIADLGNPFPNGIQEPIGASLGLRTDLGRAVTFYGSHPKNPYMQRWTLSAQRELSPGLLLDATYVGNRGTGLMITRQLDAIPSQYLSTSPIRDQAAIDYLSANVKNPFASIADFAGSGLSGSTVGRSQLLRPMPHFTSVSAPTEDGFSWYHSLQIRSEKRFTTDYSLQFAYTWSKFMEAVSYLNESDLYPERVISTEDRPHRVSASSIWRLPFGKGRKFASGAHGIEEHLIGGWQLEGIFQFQSGAAISFGNVIFNGDIKNLRLPSDQRSVDRWFDTDAGFEKDSRKQLGSNLRTFPSRFGGVRAPSTTACDVSLVKDFRPIERLRVQLRGEFYNVFNQRDLSTPNTSPTSTAFGQITSTQASSNPRWVWVALKLMF